MDSLAKEIGYLPRRHWLFTQNRLGWKLSFGPMSSSHYRLCGPDCKPGYARRVIHRLPNGELGYEIKPFSVTLQGILTKVRLAKVSDKLKTEAKMSEHDETWKHDETPEYDALNGSPFDRVAG